MCEMVFDGNASSLEVLAWKVLFKLEGYGVTSTAVAYLLPDQSDGRTVSNQVSKPPEEICAGIGVDGDYIYLTERNPSLGKAVLDRLRRKARPVLDTVEPLLLRRGNQRSTLDKTG